MFRFANGDEYAGEFVKGRRHGRIRAVLIDDGQVRVSKFDGDNNTGRACNITDLMKDVNAVVAKTEQLADDCQGHVIRKMIK